MTWYVVLYLFVRVSTVDFHGPTDRYDDASIDLRG